MPIFWLLNLLLIAGAIAFDQSAPKFVATGASGYAYQGWATAVSGDGATACVGGRYDNNNIGAVWMWTLANPFDYSSWSQQGVKLIPADGTGAAYFGVSCSLNFNGSFAVIGGFGDNNYVGATWMFTRNATGWYQQGSKYVGFPYGASPSVFQGVSVSVASITADAFVTGGYQDSSDHGAFWVFSTAGSGWAQKGGKMVGSGGSSTAFQGLAVSMSADSTTIASGGHGQAGGGAVWVFTLNVGMQYQQQGSMLTAFPATVDFGYSVALSADGSTLAVGAPSDGAGVGAMYAFTRTGGVAWAQLGVVNIGGGYVGTTIYQGRSISISANGNLIAVGGFYDNNNIGAAWVWVRNITCPFFCQYGDKVFGADFAGAGSYQGDTNSLSLSSDGSLLLVGGDADNNYIGAFWSFNDSYVRSPMATPCPRPSDTSTLSYSSSCVSWILNGTMCTPVCTSSYSSSGSLSQLCNNGTLSPLAGTCTPNCPALFNITANANYGTCSANYPSGGSCAIQCASDATLISGSSAASCSTSGVWTPPTAVCATNACNRPSNTNSTIYSTPCPSLLTNGSSCVPVCNSGYTATGSLQITCTAGVLSSPSGVCNPNSCAQLPDTASETFSACGALTTSGSVCTPACKSGYNATASISLLCLAGNFSAPAGYCAANPCVAFPNAPNTDYSPCSASTPSSSTCMPTCQSGYSAVGDITIICLAGVFQQLSSGSCQPSPCPLPTLSFPKTPGNCPLSISSGTPCSIGCAAGYVANGSLVVTCTNGVLTAPTGVCHVSTSNYCSAPTPIYPLTAGNCPPSSPNGTICVLNCSSGYSPSVTGDFNAICNNQTFTISSTAECVPNPCYISSLALAAGFIPGSCPLPVQPNTTCDLACDVGYTTVGSLEVSCNAGQFSSIAGSCLPNPCNPPFVSPTTAMVVPPSCLASQTPSGSSCTLQCITGFTPLGSLRVTCSLGNFSQVGSLGSCVGVANIASSASSLSSPGGLVASAGTVITIALSAQGNPPADMVVSKYTVTYQSTVYNATAATNFGMPDLGLNTTVIGTIQVYVRCPSLGLTTDTLLSAFPPANVVFMPTPVLKSVCPDKILAQSNQTVVVQATGFVANAPITCVLNGVLGFPASYSYLTNPSTVTCVLYWPDPTPNQIVALNIANDGSVSVFHTQARLNITIQGACDSQKPGSVAGINAAGQSGCICLAGAFDNNVACQLCANGFYQDNDGATSCKPCGSNEDTNGATGSAAVAACVCSGGYFRDPRTATCARCITGMFCPGNDIVEINPGFWRANNSTAKVLACPAGSASCIGTNNKSSSLCAAGYTGPICNVCQAGYAKRGDLCVQCLNQGLNGFALFVLIVLAVLLAYFLIRSASDTDDGEYTSSAEKAAKQREGSLEVVVKVLLNYLQVLYYIGRLSSNWSDLAHRFFESIGVVGALSPQTYTIHCAVNWRYYDSLIFIFISPLLVVAILFVVYGVRHFVRGLDLKASQTDYQLAVMLLLYQIHPTILLQVISAFPCQHIGGTKTSFLEADMNVDCKSHEYKSYVAVASVYLILYVLGMVVAALYQLHHNHVTGKLHQPSHNAYFKYRFFWMGFRPSAYYWEAVIMLRKMGVVAFSVLSNNMLQLVFANVIVIVAHSLNSQQTPFASHFVNQLESMSLIVLFITIVLGFIFLSTGDKGGGNTIWISAMLIIINVIMMAVFVFFSFRFIRKHMNGLIKRFQPEGANIKMTKNSRASSNAPSSNFEMTDIEQKL